MHRDKITLTQEKETLLIPLYSKAAESRRAHPILVDEPAQAIVAQIDFDWSRLRVKAGTRIMLAMRAKKLDRCTQDYLAQHDHALVLHLGCGLDSRVVRVAHPQAHWYDLDYPDVIALRRRFYQEHETYHMIGSSVLDFRWMDSIVEQGPAMIVAEGLLMYLAPREVKALLLKLQERFQPFQIAFDAFSTAVARRAGHIPSIKQTGAHVKWGIDQAAEIEQWAPGIQLLEEWSFTESEDIDNLSLWYQLLFKSMGHIPAARTAHRILRYQVGSPC